LTAQATRIVTGVAAYPFPWALIFRLKKSIERIGNEAFARTERQNPSDFSRR
jgi:hypothetical protein